MRGDKKTYVKETIKAAGGRQGGETVNQSIIWKEYPDVAEFPQIVMFGDSMVQGAWRDPKSLGLYLELKYLRRWDVLNRGNNGYNTNIALPALRAVLNSPAQRAANVKIFILWLGTNDASPPSRPQHVPEKEYKQNLRTMIQLVEETYPNTKILLLTCPPVNLQQWIITLKELQIKGLSTGLKQEYSRQYADAMLAVAAEYQRKGHVGVIDIWNVMENAAFEYHKSNGGTHVQDRKWHESSDRHDALATFSRDGVHLNFDGYGLVSEAVGKYIHSHWKELHWSTIPPALPAYDSALKLEGWWFDESSQGKPSDRNAFIPASR